MLAYAVDLELTDLDPDRGDVVAAAFVPIGDGVVGMPRVYTVRRGVVGPSALIHGIVAGAGEVDLVELGSVLVRVSSTAPVVVYGRHDVEFIKRALKRVGFRGSFTYFDVMMDVLRIPSVAEFARTRGRLTLGDVARMLLGVEYDEHDVASDALVTALVFLKLRKSGIAKPRRARVSLF